MAEGDGSSRNFRSAYYEKLGFSGNEEKNVLDLLIASSPFDLEKLSDLSERFDLDRRCVEAWKILLGVECGRKNPFDDYANVRRVRAEHFQSLKHHLEVLLKHNIVMKNRLNKSSKSVPKPLDNYKHSNENSNRKSQEQQNDVNVFNKTDDDENIGLEQGYSGPDNTNGTANNISENADGLEKQFSRKFSFENIETNPGRLITLMYLLEAGQLESSDIDAQLGSDHCSKLSAMASFFVNISNDLQEAFFLFRNFIRKLEMDETLMKPQVDTNKV